MLKGIHVIQVTGQSLKHGKSRPLMTPILFSFFYALWILSAKIYYRKSILTLKMHQTYLFIINCIETMHHVYRSKSTAENPPFYKAVIPTLLTHLCLSTKTDTNEGANICMHDASPCRTSIFVNLPENRSGTMRVDSFVNFSTCRTSCNIGTVIS